MTLPPPLHRWDVSPKEAIGIQKALAAKVRTETLERPVRHIAGVDVSIRGDRFQTAIAVISYPDLELVEDVTCQGDVPFPYIPGLLSFREMPAILPCTRPIRDGARSLYDRQPGPRSSSTIRPRVPPGRLARPTLFWRRKNPIHRHPCTHSAQIKATSWIWLTKNKSSDPSSEPDQT